MPQYKHPCPHCGQFITRDVAACPYCGTSDPFAPGRCPDCRAVIEDPAWVVCPRCGRSLRAGETASTAGPRSAGAAAPGPVPAAGPASSAGGTTPATPAVAGASRCASCGSALPPGARFCLDCGALVG